MMAVTAKLSRAELEWLNSLSGGKNSWAAQGGYMEQGNRPITLSIAGIECGGNHSVADLQAISALLSMATKVFAAGGGGRFFCCEPEARRSDNPIAQILIHEGISAVGSEILPPIGSLVIEGRKFTFRLEAINDLV